MSLLLPVADLATVPLPGLAALIGPVHGTAYLTVISTSYLAPASGRARWKALIPGVGGLLALRGARSEPQPEIADADADAD